MAKNNQLRDIKKNSTNLGKDTTFSGTMRFNNVLTIEGKFKGDIESEGMLIIEDGAYVKAEIRVRSIIIGGVVHGNIVATERAEMLSTGKVYGNVRTARLRIADNVVFEGKCEMIRDADAIDIFATTPMKLKNTVQSV